ncbi:MAG TPA: hypothetical protein VIS05_01930 [Ilumatobacter sp.]
MLHPYDDFLLHQTPQPLSHPGSESPNVYDRFFFNGYRADGSVFFAVALGAYPNRRVMDAAFSVIRGGVQHNVRASRLCPDDRTDTAAGPLRVEIVEPMRRHRITVDDRHGISADLTMTAITPAIEEPRFVHTVGARTFFDYTRLTQFGRWDGWIEVDGERITIDASVPVVGTRDRSWGVRPLGEARPGPRSAPQFFWMWAPTVFDDACTHLAVNHESDGRAWHESGAVVPRLGPGEPTLDPGRVQRGTGAGFDVRWRPGTRWAEHLTTRLAMWGGDPVEVTYEPFLTFHMVGIGYRHPTWGHGCWVGVDESTRDQIVLADVDPLDPLMLHVQALAHARWGDRRGVGVVEQLIIGPHEPTGLTGVIDPAR